MKAEEILYDGCRQMGILITDKQIEKMMEFKKIVLDWNKKMNLTSIKNERDFIIKHLLDSISCLTIDEVKNEQKIIDIGTGAGFPSIPLKILLPETELTLLDSSSKKIGFLEEVCRSLGLEKIEAIHGRAEELGQNRDYRECYDLVLARAVAPMNVLVEYCLPFLKVEGHFVCQKGPRLEEEIKTAKIAIDTLGGEVKYIEKISLPFEDLDHKILVIEKVNSSPTKYPRKVGKPTKKPM
ncbi:16S rRNA (guanine(527)-N(7))-methyltransferase RsmG [Alkaliphilus transvaalensis]|nr:16S rRNA (guanine(527)-N(7))-methyltransferase RsmG [Alkaliphilus transvaalensis]